MKPNPMKQSSIAAAASAILLVTSAAFAAGGAPAGSPDREAKPANAAMPATPATPAVPSERAAIPAEQLPRRSDKLFERLDRDRDGVVSRAEAVREPLLAKGFDDADENRDGRLTSDEFVKAHSIYDRARIASYSRDAYLTAKVKAVLLKDSTVSGLDVSVETRRGIVTLSGEVSSRTEAERAKLLAAGVDGVEEVVDRLVVKQG